jgi:predicted dinucleotide-binding enzyme
MKIGVFGTGDVGRSLGRAFIALGHDVKMGARAAGHEKALEWVAEMGGRASEGTFADAARFGEMLVMATLGVANPEVVRLAGPNLFTGKILIDATNPLDFSKGFPPGLTISGNDSAGELLQRLMPEAKVVKAFNTVGNRYFYKPKFENGPPDMFIAGNDADAKKKIAELLVEFGWGVVDIGDIAGARYLEAMCIAWVRACGATNNWNRAFKFLG